MLSYQTIEPHTLELLRQLMAEPSLSETRLVGGTSLALQYGHRNSVDLDFFGALDDDLFNIRKCLTNIGHLSILKASQIIAAIRKKKSKAYVSKRWHILAIINKFLPFGLYKRM